MNKAKKNSYDFVIIGGGLLGLASARALLQLDPTFNVCVVEKESKAAQHQSGRNSGVIHSGIYYKAGSLKASLNAQGRKKLIEYCQKKNIPHNICGKVILAHSEEELSRLKGLAAQAKQHGLEAQMIDQSELANIEPHAKAQAAIWLPETGIVDFATVANSLVVEAERNKAHVVFDTRVEEIREYSSHVSVRTNKAELFAKGLINCAGLFSDHIARLAGLKPQARIIPFRGQYFRLKPSASHLVRGLIYPLPDPQYPFLGVHLSTTMSGEVLAGPNATLSLKREGYHPGDFNLADALNTFSFPGFWRLAAANPGLGARGILRAWNVNLFAKSLKKMVPAIGAKDLELARSGVRAQALSRKGELLDDFQFERGEHSLHVINAPSPAATACLAIGEYIANEVTQEW